jgi:hypothetical protein
MTAMNKPEITPTDVLEATIKHYSDDELSFIGSLVWSEQIDRDWRRKEETDAQQLADCVA